jgi:hypothetical protein
MSHVNCNAVGDRAANPRDSGGFVQGAAYQYERVAIFCRCKQPPGEPQVIPWRNPKRSADDRQKPLRARNTRK